MDKAISLAILATGIMLTIFGVNEMHTVTPDVVSMLMSTPDNSPTYMIVGGVVLVVLGALGDSVFLLSVSGS